MKMLALRILFVSSPGLGHLNPMLPLAERLRARGADVLFATGPDEVEAVRNGGFRAEAAGLGERERWPLVAELAGPGLLTEDGRPTEKASAANVFGLLFGRVGAIHRAPDLDRIAAGWPPDLLIHDLSEFASAPLAARLGIPHITHSWGGFLPEAITGSAAREAAPLWERAGLPAPPDGGLYEHLYLVLYPRSLRGPAADLPPRSGEVRPQAPNETVPAPSWLAGVRGAVYLTLGTIFNDARALGAMARSLAGLGRPVIVTSGPRLDPADLGELPDGVRAARYIPQESVLSKSSVVVSHAGSGTFLGAARHGLPQVLVPRGADQRFNAEAAAAAGVGIALDPAEAAAPGALRAAVERALADSAMEERARAVRAEIAAMPEIDCVAAGIELRAAAGRAAKPG